MRRWVLLAGLCAASCGYRTGLTLGPEYRSIGVEIFGRDGESAPIRNLERDLHAELVRSSRSLITAQLVRPSQADVVLRGRITGYERRPGVRSSGNVQLESGVVVDVEAELWDPLREKRVGVPVGATVRLGFTLDAPEAELEARRRALRNLADRIVIDLATRVSARAAASGAEEQP